MINIAIIGGSGYTGFELLRLLATHKHTEVVAVTSRQYKGKYVAEVWPSLQGYYDGLCFTDESGVLDTDAELFFCALPHGASMAAVPRLLEAGAKVIDLSADFRLQDVNVYEDWYAAHTAKDLIKEAVYGLPELFKDAIKDAQLVANPGCYPTAALLALAPLFTEQSPAVVKPGSIIIDAKSGVSGAGRAASVNTSFVEVASGFKAYKIGSHRHTPEIEEVLSGLCGDKTSVTFTPHLLPISRGILATIYATLNTNNGNGGKTDTKTLLALYHEFYDKTPFVRVCETGDFPDISRVAGSNFCDIGLHVEEATNRVIIVSAIDNLTKGASGQAIQNMNIMSGYDEAEGLNSPALGI